MTGEAREHRGRVLVVDDDPIVAESIAEVLSRLGYETATAASGEESIDALRDAQRDHEPFAVVVCDVSMPGMGGMETLKQIRREHPASVVVMLTGYATIEAAVEAVRHGAADYLAKPVVDEELRISVEKAARQHALLAENAALRMRLKGRSGLGAIVGADHRMQRVYELIGAVAPTRTTVLLTGESGTGKSLVARAIHDRSDRAAGPFIEISCGSIPETILESELFGHVRGAFTGAHADKRGRFLTADRGTIFLDEINAASPAMQLKLLRVLQERRFEPVGSTRTVTIDTRVILASNEALEPLVERGVFRRDLYYRVNVVKIELPPLRERIADIPPLVAHFMGLHALELGRSFEGVSPDAMAALRRYHFPGNVRELSNMLERACVLAQTDTITPDLLPACVAGDAPGRTDADAPHTDWSPIPLADALRDPERRILLKALRANGWNRQKTADDLGVNRTTLYKKMKQHGLDRLAG